MSRSTTAPCSLLSILALAAALAAPARAQSAAIPFPVDKTVELKEPGQVYTVEGRQVIKSNVKITVLRHCTIKGVGDGATLVLEGQLKMKAVTGGIVRFDGVTLEIGPRCKELTLSNVDFAGGGHGMRTTEGQPSRAKMFLIATNFTGGSRCELTANDGKIEMQNSNFDELLTIVGAPRSEKSGSNVVIQLEGCCGQDGRGRRGMLGGLKITGGKSALVRNCDLGGAETTFADVPKLDFDGNNVRSTTTTFSQSRFGAFGGTEIGNCDFRAKIVFHAPPDDRDPQKAERVMLDHSFFDGRTEPDQIAQAMIVDQRRDPEVSVLCTFSKILPVPLGLAGGG